jgi:hypothetical protein
LLHHSRVAEIPYLQINEALGQELKSLLSSAIDYWLDKEIRSNSFIDHLEHWPQAEVSS